MTAKHEAWKAREAKEAAARESDGFVQFERGPHFDIRQVMDEGIDAMEGMWQVLFYSATHTVIVATVHSERQALRMCNRMERVYRECLWADKWSAIV